MTKLAQFGSCDQHLDLRTLSFCPMEIFYHGLLGGFIMFVRMPNVQLTTITSRDKFGSIFHCLLFIFLLRSPHDGLRADRKSVV